jgi:hypothetical protein
LIEPSAVTKRGGGENTPSDKGYIEIYSTQYAFAALKADGSITAWGGSNDGGTDAPKGGKGKSI